MEVRVRERLIGALVLVAIVVLIVPAILKGRDEAPAVSSETAPTRRVEVPIGDSTPVPEDQVLVPEPAPPDVRRDVAPAPAPDPDATGAAAEPGVLPPPPAPMPKPKSPATDPPAKSQAAPAPAATTSAWAVQLGAFSNQSKAEQLVVELRKRRYAAFVLEYRAGGQVLYRVRVGPEQDRARAVETAARLEKDGFQPVVARHP
jgi:DedD protein